MNDQPKDFPPFDVLKEFRESYDDYPNQDTEGWIPDRGSYKSGFFACYNKQNIELARRNDKITELEQKVKDLEAKAAEVEARIWEEAEREVYFDDKKFRTALQMNHYCAERAKEARSRAAQSTKTEEK